MAQKTYFWSGLKPTPFRDFITQYGTDPDVELIDGAVVERMPAQLEHDHLRDWLQTLLGEFLKARKYGTLFDASMPLMINDRRGRRPDLMFVARENQRIIRDGALFGAPDVVIEIVSAYDFRTDLTIRENDYKSVGVPEIVFLDPSRHQGKIIRRRHIEMTYDEENLPADGLLKMKGLNLVLLMEWLVLGQYPDQKEVMQKIVHPLQRRV